MTNPRKLDLLAPAGDWSAMKAAIANGADAVYFGLAQFSARARATNFRLEELPEVMQFLHDYNLRGYVAMNTLIYPDELVAAGQYVQAVAQAGADAVIVQDLGLAMLVHRLCPDLPVHASTQMTLSEPLGIGLAGQLGLRRVILPRELSIDEIHAVAIATDLELEVFAHGAICISYSGQCWASESFWGRSGNRGLCGQACRLPYQLIVDGQPVPSDALFPLSPQDLAAYDRVDRLAAAGVHGLKIEGRLKGPHYVAAACGVYRQAIDAAAAGQPFQISRRQELELAQGFSRGFSHGYLDGPDHRDLVQGQSPKPRGLRLGKVAQLMPRAVVLALDAGIECPKPGDGVVFDRPGEIRKEEDERGGRVYSARLAKSAGGTHVELAFENALDLSAIGPGDVVWKTDDPQIRRDLERTTARLEVHTPVPLNVVVEAVAGQRLRVTFQDDRGNVVTAESEQPLEPARRAATSAMLREQLGRLGGTPFAVGSLELRGASGPVEQVDLLIPKSVLNQLRRRAVEDLQALRRRQDVRTIAQPDALAQLGQEARHELESKSAGASARMNVLVRTLEQAQVAVEMWRAAPAETSGVAPGLIYLDLSREDELDAAVAIVRQAGLPLALAGPRIVKPLEQPLLQRLAAMSPQAVLVRNLGTLAFFRAQCPAAVLIGDASLNAANALTAMSLTQQGLSRLTPAYDLPVGQLRELAAASPGAFEIVLYQHVPLMHMAHCLFARLAGSTNCERCPMPCRTRDLKLRDRNGVDHPVRTDLARRTTVFRGEIESRLEQLPEWARMGVRQFRMEFLDESADQMRRLVADKLNWH